MTYTKEEARQELEKLVERFRDNIDVYKRSTYNQAGEVLYF